MNEEFRIVSDYINNKLERLENSLKEHIKNKIDLIAQEIVTEMISSNFKKAVEKKSCRKIK